MTHEQKLECAEFRTREDLLPCPFCGAVAERLDFDDGENIGGSCISCTRCGASGHVEFGFKENFVSQWNTRVSNTAEQRRKGAEGVEPRACDNCGGSGYPDGSPYSCSVCEGSGEINTRPANVAALEARVRELEEAKGRKQEEARRYHNALSNIVAKTGSHSVAHRIALEALPAIRDGGEHG